MDKAIKIIKYIVFFIFLLLLLLFWKSIFVLQGAIGFDGPLYLLQIKIIPILITSFVVAYLIIKMFDYKKVVLKPKKTSFIAGGVAILLSLTFQHFCINSHLKPFKFSNNNFSHLEPVQLQKNEFAYRMAISAAAYSKIMPLGQVDDETTSYLSNVALESSLIFNIKKLVDDKNIENTCKQYIEQDYKIGSCIIDLQNEIYSKYKFTSTGNVLLVAVGALGTFKMKKIMSEKYGKKDLFVLTKSVNDIIETSLLSAARSKDLITSQSESIDFTLGHHMEKASMLFTIEKQINYKYLATAFDKIGGLLEKSKEKISKSENDKKRDISSVKDNIKAEIKRSEELSRKLSKLQENGFDVESLEEKQKAMDEELEAKFQKLKNESLIYRVSSLFNPELKNMTIEELMRKEEKEEAKKEEI